MAARRLSMKPGINLLWQISGRNEVSLRGLDEARPHLH